MIRTTKAYITVRDAGSVLDPLDIPELIASVIRFRKMDVRIKMISVFVFCCNSDVMWLCTCSIMILPPLNILVAFSDFTYFVRFLKSSSSNILLKSSSILA
jgi:hypothetical protein